jgi:hypothetical protein
MPWLVETFAVISLPAQTIPACSPFKEDWAVVARQVCGANFGQICQHIADITPDELHGFYRFDLLFLVG